MKKLLIASLLISSFCFSQEKQTYIKANAATVVVGIVNVGVEHQLTNKITAQADVFISPWKSFVGKPLQIYMGHLEGRYYFKEAFKSWYVGLNAGGAAYELQKWNYAGKNTFQRGFGLMIGGVVGYQFKWTDRLNVDAFVGGGTMQAFYHSYTREGNQVTRYVEDTADGYNKSGEILPYRGGLMISYKL